MADDPTKTAVEGSEKERHLAGANSEMAGRAPSTPGGSREGTGDRTKSDGEGRADVRTGERPQPKSGEG